MVPLLGAIAGCHCSVLWLSGRGAIAGAIAGCHCSARWLVGGDDQLWGSGRGGIAECYYGWGGDGQFRSGRGAIAGCHCSVGGEGDDQLWGVDVVPLAEWMWCHCRGAIVVACYGSGGG